MDTWEFWLGIFCAIFGVIFVFMTLPEKHKGNGLVQSVGFGLFSAVLYSLLYAMIKVVIIVLSEVQS